MRGALIIFCCIVNLVQLSGQSYFNILPDVGGVQMQGWGKAIITDSSSIFVLGHRYDTTTPGFTALPWIGEFNYNGELIIARPIIDQKYSSPFKIDEVHIAHKFGDVYYIFSKRFLGEDYYTPYLFELNVRKGELIKSALIPNQTYPDKINGQSSILFDHDNTITLLNYVDLPNLRKTYITELDTFFQTKRIIEVANFANNQTPLSLKVNQDRTYSIVGTAAYMDNLGNEIYDTYFLKTDTIGNILENKRSPASIPVSQLLAVSNTVEIDDVGNWVIAGQQHISLISDSCMNCEDLVPYIFSASSDFSTVLWQTRFSDLPISEVPSYYVYGMTKTFDGYIGAGDFIKVGYPGSYWPAGGLLFKASNTGDSLWMKYYIPLNWEESRVWWAQLHDIKMTSLGSIVTTGVISDKELNILRPWILHLDSDGCLVPGCNTVSTVENNQKGTKQYFFKIYPNPVSEEIYLFSSISTPNPVNIQIVSSNGRIVKSRDFLPNAGFQYILPIEDLIPGIYHLILTEKGIQRSESHTFIRQ